MHESMESAMAVRNTAYRIHTWFARAYILYIYILNIYGGRAVRGRKEEGRAWKGRMMKRGNEGVEMRRGNGSFLSYIFPMHTVY